MPKIVIPTPLRKYTDNTAVAFIEGKTILESLNNLIRLYPDFDNHLINEGEVVHYIKIFKDNINIDDLEGINTSVNQNETLQILIPIAGG